MEIRFKLETEGNGETEDVDADPDACVKIPTGRTGPWGTQEKS